MNTMPLWADGKGVEASIEMMPHFDWYTTNLGGAYTVSRSWRLLVETGVAYTPAGATPIGTADTELSVQHRWFTNQLGSTRSLGLLASVRLPTSTLRNTVSSRHDGTLDAGLAFTYDQEGYTTNRTWLYRLAEAGYMMSLWRPTDHRLTAHQGYVEGRIGLRIWHSANQEWGAVPTIGTRIDWQHTVGSAKVSVVEAKHSARLMMYRKAMLFHASVGHVVRKFTTALSASHSLLANVAIGGAW